jgi:hypothetical protein
VREGMLYMQWAVWYRVPMHDLSTVLLAMAGLLSVPVGRLFWSLCPPAARACRLAIKCGGVWLWC